MAEILKQLREAAGENCILEQESMREHTTFRIGGPADLFAAPAAEQQAAAVVRV